MVTALVAGTPFGRWASGYFIVWLFLVTFVFGGALVSGAALPVDAMSPSVLPN